MLAGWVPESLSDVMLSSVFLAGRANKPVRRPNHVSSLEDQGQRPIADKDQTGRRQQDCTGQTGDECSAGRQWMGWARALDTGHRGPRRTQWAMWWWCALGGQAGGPGTRRGEEERREELTRSDDM